MPSKPYFIYYYSISRYSTRLWVFSKQYPIVTKIILPGFLPNSFIWTSTTLCGHAFLYYFYSVNKQPTFIITVLVSQLENYNVSIWPEPSSLSKNSTLFWIPRNDTICVSSKSDYCKLMYMKWFQTSLRSSMSVSCAVTLSPMKVIHMYRKLASSMFPATSLCTCLSTALHQRY